MYGKYRHSVDPKGRLFVPAKLRDELGEAFYVTLGLDKCLTVYTQASWDSFMEKYNAVPFYQLGTLRFLLANVVKCVGQGTHAEIWDAETYDQLEQVQLNPENLLSAMKELGF